MFNVFITYFIIYKINKKFTMSVGSTSYEITKLVSLHIKY